MLYVVLSFVTLSNNVLFFVILSVVVFCYSFCSCSKLFYSLFVVNNTKPKGLEQKLYRITKYFVLSFAYSLYDTSVLPFFVLVCFWFLSCAREMVKLFQQNTGVYIGSNGAAGCWRQNWRSTCTCPSLSGIPMFYFSENFCWEIHLETRFYLTSLAIVEFNFKRKCLFAHSVCANFGLNAHSVCANFGLNAHSPSYFITLLK